MFTAALPPGRREVLERLAGIQNFQGFYLAGGTAVALHLGHRISEDFDFFTPHDFDVSSLRDELHGAGEFILTDMKKGTLHGIFNNVKVSFLFYAPRLAFPAHIFSGCPVADLRDLAPIKLDAIGSRGSKKDFIDIYFISTEAIPLKEIFDLYKKKYSYLQINIKHLIMSLTYFEDADRSRDEIIMLKKTAKWPEIKKYFEKQAAAILDEMRKSNIYS
ncbi:MAG TPA: nucleotidyl transferase AbiEii/AbiGii toxin family protein [Bacillota bacterium]|nr:nucleotidyl transferase AbiEii/AbiGii toxin family protein [Bacillota bacterium]